MSDDKILDLSLADKPTESDILNLWMSYDFKKREEQLEIMDGVDFDEDEPPEAIAQFLAIVEMLRDWHEEMADYREDKRPLGFRGTPKNPNGKLPTPATPEPTPKPYGKRIIYARGFSGGRELAMIRGGATKDKEIQAFLMKNNFRYEDAPIYAWKRIMDEDDFHWVLHKLHVMGCAVMPKSTLSAHLHIDFKVAPSNPFGADDPAPKPRKKHRKGKR